jgi:hypothetical protein
MRGDKNLLSDYKVMIDNSEYISEEEKEKLIDSIETTFNTYTKIME